MIDQQFQGLDYGFHALELVIKYVKSLPDSHEFFLGYVPEQGNPKGFYGKLGFVDTGEMEVGELIMKLEFK